MSRPRDIQSIEAVLHQYETALNAGDIDTILTLYTEDGIFMPQHFPAQVGQQAVREAYIGVFKMLDLNVAFIIHEVEPFGDYAFARTSSRGKTQILAEGIETDESNNELFVFQHKGNDWKIARYLFATALPPR